MNCGNLERTQLLINLNLSSADVSLRFCSFRPDCVNCSFIYSVIYVLLFFRDCPRGPVEHGAKHTPLSLTLCVGLAETVYLNVEVRIISVCIRSGIAVSMKVVRERTVLRGISELT